MVYVLFDSTVNHSQGSVECSVIDGIVQVFFRVNAYPFKDINEEKKSEGYEDSDERINGQYVKKCVKASFEKGPGSQSVLYPSAIHVASEKKGYDDKDNFGSLEK